MPRRRPGPLRVFLAGASGDIGRATAAALIAAGHRVVALQRPGARPAPPGVEVRIGQVCDPGAVGRAFGGDRFDVVISCLASRSGVADDAWRVDHDANLTLLHAARGARFVLVSAICLQRPRLAFQQAKLAFEDRLRQTQDWTIIRPTAFFKSLSGQVARVMAGRPYLVFGDGRRTACKPISDRDLAAFILARMTDPGAVGAILPIGGPGPAITPLDQVDMLAGLLGHPVKVRHVPPALMDGIAGALGLAGRIAPGLRAKAELARIGRYYATESMLVWNAATGAYDAGATPEFGADRLKDHYAALIRGEARVDLGAQRVFSQPA